MGGIMVMTSGRKSSSASLTGGGGSGSSEGAVKLPAKVSQEVGSGVSELYIKYDCNYCQEDIPGLRVKCADCPDFDLCLPCFCCGAQIGKHKNTHRYLFMNNGGFPIFPRPKDLEGNLHRFRTTQLQHMQQAHPPGLEDWNAR